MAKFQRSLLLCAILGLAPGAYADAMNGYVSIGGAYVKHTTAVESGARINYKLEFARLVKNISAELRFGNGINYNDYGGTLKGYWHFYLDEPTTSGTGFGLGTGLGAMYSDAASQIGGSSPRAFTDVIIQPFVRFLWDSKYNVGAVLEGGMDWVPYRAYSGSTLPKSDSTSRMRFYISLGIAIGA